MAAQFCLSPGEVQAIAQNVEYALPSFLVYIQSSVAIESTSDGTTWGALTGANTVGVLCAARAIRCPTASASIICKRYQ
jgi:hypothetical protein